MNEIARSARRRSQTAVDPVQALKDCHFILIDDHELILRGLAEMISEIKVSSVSIHSKGKECSEIASRSIQEVEEARKQSPNKRIVFVIDYNHGGFYGTELAKNLLSKDPGLVIFCFSLEDPDMIKHAYAGIALAGVLDKTKFVDDGLRSIAEFMNAALK